ncbi:MAG: hypothetical protein E6076_03185 [Peptoniphilus harei]|uniref:hypothetical protein n=1 Tax=Peptoniphilus harei TaxID=54005 RepID=UPI002911414B|nr:hypothetical protein [Peptoniphilus harei]MDU5470827.1 hypothetical protein [Peptoniphilus harei]MDU6098421.1 hypothetical protein [Peptoniphilus harei]
MKKYFKILLVFAGLILLLTGCENKSLYSMKTDLSNEKGLEKLIGSMDWGPYKLEAYKVKNQILEIKLSGESDISQDKAAKTGFINGVILLILTDAEEVRYSGEDLYFHLIDKDLANEVLKIKYGKEVDDYKKSQEDFDNLIERLKNEKFETGAAKFEMME